MVYATGKPRDDIKTGSDAYLWLWARQDQRRENMHPSIIPLENRSDAIVMWHAIGIQHLVRSLARIKSGRDSYWYNDDDIKIGFKPMWCGVKFFEMYREHFALVQGLLDMILLNEKSMNRALYYGQVLNTNNTSMKPGSATNAADSANDAKSLDPKIRGLVRSMLLDTGL